VRRAQRLTASENPAVEVLHGLLAFTRRVLNALRHQRIQQSRRRTWVQSCRICAQRLTASENPAEPFPDPLRISVYVLNALRHQRIQQPFPGAIWAVVIRLCSTPYGIRESSSLTSRLKMVPLELCAQRLTASENPAVAEGAAVWPGSSSCSTPYGIRESSSLPPRPPHTTGFQTGEIKHLP